MNSQNISTWTLHKNGFPECNGNVPCSMYSVLLENALIPDPFTADNEYTAYELSLEDCDFTSEFSLDGEAIKSENLFIRFSGLDTLATVFINEKQVGEANNMHRIWEFDIKPHAISGKNKIRVHFASPTVYMEKKQDEHYVYGDGNSGKGIAHLRKSLCMSGWDWAPKLPDMGFYRPVEILAFNTARIENVFIRQEHSKGKVILNAELTVSKKDRSSAFMTVVSPKGEELNAEFVDSKASVTVNNPELWWPNGLGEHPLYNVTVILKNNGETTDTWEKKIGLRTLFVSREKDDPQDPESGEEFCFVCNGIKFFAMGADYIPEDSILARLSEERTAKLLSGCAEANYNCIRVWGGGFYPHDYFYDICDKLGLVVWQDFMFACINVWMNDAFTQNVKQEAIDNVIRLRDHACIGLLCGNNEMELAVADNWGRTPPEEIEQIKADYLLLYENLLPGICNEYCPDIFYWPASPSSGGNFDDPNNEHKGDVHYWGAWHGSIPFESYRQYKFRFLSEFGFESFPNMKTIKSFALPKDLNPFSYIMESHQKCKGGNTKILTYLAGKYLYPTDFERLVYTSQLLQADAIRYGVEHFRRYRGVCMGAVYWQLNDCWPVASWASVDYYNRWKALQYSSKRFFAPTLLSLHENGTVITLNVSNEQRKVFSGTVVLRLQKNDFTVLDEKEYPVNVDAMSALDIATEDYGQMIGGNKNDSYLSYVLKDSDGFSVSGGSFIFTVPKYFNFQDPRINVEIEGGNGEFTLTVSASAYARSVEIDFTSVDVHLQDNFFDIVNSCPYVIKAHAEDKSLTKEDLVSQLTVKSVYSLSVF